MLASTSAAGLARRFGPEHLAGVEAAVADLVGRRSTCSRSSVGSSSARVSPSTWTPPTWRSTDRRSRAWPTTTKGNALAVRIWRPGPNGLTVAADLFGGNDDVRPRAADMLRRGLAGIPEPVRAPGGCRRSAADPCDAGYFTADLAHAAVAESCDFAIAAKRNTAMWRAYASIDPDAWVDAIGMPGAQVAAVDYAPAVGPPTPTRSCAGSGSRPTISADPRSRHVHHRQGPARAASRAPPPTPTRSPRPATNIPAN